MTDRYNSIIVTLSSDIRSDDAETLINAIKYLRGVIDVSGNVADLSSHISDKRARNELGRELINLIYKEKN